jgi:uncharacterized protein (TIGR02453 family)
MKSGFDGFPPEGIAFLRGLKRNNDREWFQSRKHIYEEKVKAPMVELVTALMREMRDFAPEYVDDPKKAIFRIYRDTRFSKDKAPYKTHIAAVMHRRGMSKNAGAGFYVSISPSEIEVCGGMYAPSPEELSAVRAQLAEEHGAFRSLIAGRKIRSLMGEFKGEQLTRMPKGFPCGHPAEDLLRRKQFLFWQVLEPALATGPKLFPAIVERFRAMTPFVEFINAPLVDRSTGRRREAMVFADL